MVINKKGGNKAKRKGRKNFRQKTYSLDDLIPTSSENQEYGFITDKYGDGRFSVICYDKVQRLGIVRGSIKQKSRMNKGCLVLLSLRPYEDAKCDILYQYTEDDINKLSRSKSLELSFIKSGKLSTEDDPDETIESGDAPYTTGLPSVSESISDTKSNDSVQAWESDGSEDKPKPDKRQYPDNIVNDTRCDFTKTDELNIDDI
jgi:translation initiation factor 1A